jgi:phosphoserine aminotransferase
LLRIWGKLKPCLDTFENPLEAITMKHNFTAGPAILPQSVIDKAAQAVKNFNGSGLSLLEVSHRGGDFDAVIEDARKLALEIYGLGDDYEALFMTGGASTQFALIPYNFLNAKAAYLDTGTWADKAIKEAKFFGQVDVVGSSKSTNYDHIPKGYTVPADADYFHITTNNTIFGTQIHHMPEVSVPLVADMSSDIYSREIDANKFHLIYAGAQKNLGPSGVTLVLIRKSWLEQVKRAIPTMFAYKTFVDNLSLYNTPPVFPIYVAMENLRWIKEQGGLKAVEKHNQEKAQLLYKAIDELPLFKGVAATEDRSLMNITFTLSNPDLDKAFLGEAEAAGCVGLAGHRSVGGFRASTYNALAKESVQALIDVMTEFSKKHG